jgi:AcrR family transcriptional regulator
MRIMGRGRRNAVDHNDVEETKRLIVRTAQELFMEHGYRAVTTRQIADACGLTQPALYHYFADKRDLYVAVMQNELAQRKTALERIALRSESVEERLTQVVRYLFSTEHRDHALMLHDLRYEMDEMTQKQMREAFQQSIVAPIAAIFEEGFRNGLLHDWRHCGVTAITATHMLLSMLSSLLSMAGADHAPVQVRAERAEMIVQVLLYGLMRPGTPA